MKKDNQKNRGQVRGYLFERLICLLLKQNDLMLVKPDKYNRNRERRMEIGVFFSVNGFQAEAERLAYSHGIRTISYKNNPIIQKMKDDIDVLESEHISYDLFAQKSTRFFLGDFERMMAGELEAAELVERYELAEESAAIFMHLYETVQSIRSSIMATTNTGMVFHLLSNQDFPEELFAQTDMAVGHIYYQNLSEENQIAYYLELEEDEQHRKFYFTPPEGLNDQAVYGLGGETADRMMHMTMNLGGIRRSLTIVLDTDRFGF